MTDITYRMTLWVDDERYDWSYTVPEDKVRDKHRIKNDHVPVDGLPDDIKNMSTDDITGREFVASNDDGDGLSGWVDGVTHHGTVLRLDTSRPYVSGDDFGRLDGMRSPWTQTQGQQNRQPKPRQPNSNP